MIPGEGLFWPRTAVTAEWRISHEAHRNLQHHRPRFDGPTAGFGSKEWARQFLGSVEVDQRHALPQPLLIRISDRPPERSERLDLPIRPAALGQAIVVIMVRLAWLLFFFVFFFFPALPSRNKSWCAVCAILRGARSRCGCTARLLCLPRFLLDGRRTGRRVASQELDKPYPATQRHQQNM